MKAAWRRGVLRDTGLSGAPPVVKLGGSLLTRDGWIHEVAALLDSLPPPRLLVVGGGPLVDGLRAIDRAAPLPAALVHRLAIDFMGHTARVVAGALDVPLVASASGSDRPTSVLDVPTWLGCEGRLDALPVGWHVTSDSIAAVVAAAIGSDLVLLKSVSPPHNDIERLAESGWVDAWFPTAAYSLARIAWAAPS